MKEQYQPVRLEVIAFRSEDIITTSNPTDETNNKLPFVVNVE